MTASYQKDYPRPMFVRKDWTNLNGEWDFAFDDDLAEIYGMYAFEYDGNYIGLPHIYRGLHSELSAKYNDGIIDTQLAYSPDGRFWRRSLREPFLSGINGTTDSRYNLLWSFGHSRVPGEIRLYSSVSEHEHGPAFKNPGTGRILVFKLREDGFVSLVSKDPALTSVVAPREKIWHGGERH